MKNTVIYLIGLPGTGKYTIAKEIERQSGALVIDNHLINNPIFSVIRADGKTPLPKEIWDYTAAIGDIVREVIVNLAPPEESFIFTNALTEEDPLGLAVYNKVVEVASLRKSIFAPIRLLCDLPTLQQRIVSKNRTERLKMTDAKGIAKLHRDKTILKSNHPNTMSLDVTNLEATEAAQTILTYVKTLVPAEIE
ncbi:hypothetical protein EON83_08470 [bacterium]|nr:MAG: hypothetical protein EON83_08470 [bacterium]